LYLSEARVDTIVAKELEELETDDALEHALLSSEEPFSVEAAEQLFSFYSILKMPPTS
jgi:hypothetical protein